MKNGEVVSTRYKIKRAIGRGGMQDVFLASDLLLNIDVALKTPLPGQENRRFSQSAIVAARVNHHNVAKTLDYFVAGERPYLIEEYVAGETLDAKLKRFGAVDPHLGARMFHHLAKGVGASHHAGVVHRDLKPSNVIAEEGVNLHRLKITDFGIATLTEKVFDEEAQSGDMTKSTSGTVKGALPFMAPEMMFRVPGEHPGSAADIWSLGAMMFKMLTGDYPFGVFLQAAVNVQNQKRKPWPSFMTGNPQFKPLAKELQGVIERCLQYDTAKRPTADDLMSEISNLCYITGPRFVGKVSNFIYNGRSGFASDTDGGIFFSMESAYGAKRPQTGLNISYSKFPGIPKFRGHPIIVVED